MEFNSIPLNFSYLSSHPLFSAIVALYTLILLYLPSFFLTILLSPVLNTTIIILISLLHLGVNHSFHSIANDKFYLESRFVDNKDNHYERLSIDAANLTLYSSLVLQSSSMEQRFLDYPDNNQTCVESNQTHAVAKPICGLPPDYNQIHTKVKHDLGSEYNISKNDHHKWELIDANSIESSQVVIEGDVRTEMGSKQVDTMMKILEWNMKAPLEIIYEAYEGEEEEDEGGEEEKEDLETNENNVVSSNKHDVGCVKNPFLLMYYPESETDSSSDGDFPMKEKWETHESVFLKWEEEDDDREELIEISLDRYGKRSFDFCHAEEDNLIEIDIFPTRN